MTKLMIREQVTNICIIICTIMVC